MNTINKNLLASESYKNEIVRMANNFIDFEMEFTDKYDTLNEAIKETKENVNKKLHEFGFLFDDELKLEFDDFGEPKIERINGNWEISYWEKYGWLNFYITFNGEKIFAGDVFLSKTNCPEYHMEWMSGSLHFETARFDNWKKF
jgi:hypothetical protein